MSAIGGVLDLAAARVEEEARRRASNEDRDRDRQQNAGGHQDESKGVDLHSAMVGHRTGAEVGPKVTSTPGRWRFLAGAGP